MSQTLPIKPESQIELANISKVSEYSVKFGAEKEQIAREAVEKNGFDFLCAGRNPIGFVWYEFTKGEMLLQAKREKEIEQKKRKRTTMEEEEESKRVQQQQNPSRPNMKIAILEVVKKHLQPFYANKDISKEEYKTICKKTCEKVMSKELQVKDEEESVKMWLDEHAKKKIRGLVETFVEKTRGGGGGARR